MYFHQMRVHTWQQLARQALKLAEYAAKAAEQAGYQDTLPADGEGALAKEAESLRREQAAALAAGRLVHAIRDYYNLAAWDVLPVERRKEAGLKCD